ncbi:hypothetical protein NSPZN2_40657 [Nitrospira defluvii]|uniref:Uncharacterized protein n=1 Tax=Nitrospira defluvii TaxID=330214 RepID=A0ABM8RYV5_9BACT|nr:hypothetical protein NSPZN2_40657 [Nitrospira defluvii]
MAFAPVTAFGEKAIRSRFSEGSVRDEQYQSMVESIADLVRAHPSARLCGPSSFRPSDP